MVTSKFKFVQVYLTLILIIVLIGFITFFFLHPHESFKTKFGANISGVVFGFVFLILIVFIYYPFLKNLYTIEIIGQTIFLQRIFYKKEINEDDIKRIDLFSQKNLGIISGNATTIATLIELTNGEQIIIADVLYKNIDEIKQVLSENFKQKIQSENLVVNKKNNFVVESLGEEVFAGSQFTSVNGILFYGLMSFMFFIFFISGRLQNSVGYLIRIYVFIFLMWYFILGFQMYYFVISSGNLIIKNHFWFWYKKNYSLDNISEVNFESPYNRSKALRITTNDFSSKLYSAGSLRKHHWQALKNKFISLAIPFKE